MWKCDVVGSVRCKSDEKKGASHKSIPEIDQQLYKKYNLSEDEINFIEKMIKPMELIIFWNFF